MTWRAKATSARPTSRHVTDTLFEPSFIGLTASYDVASTSDVCGALLLGEYLRTTGNTPPAVSRERERRVAALRENMNSAQLWCEFLEAEGELDDPNETRAVNTRNGVGLHRLYGRGSHSSTIRLNVSTFCRIRWVNELPPVY
jgi:hypothetical protein